jgi:hypothetical protein
LFRYNGPVNYYVLDVSLRSLKVRERNGNSWETAIENKEFTLKTKKWYNVRIDIKKDKAIIWFNLEDAVPEAIFGEGGAPLKPIIYTDEFDRHIHTFGFYT